MLVYRIEAAVQVSYADEHLTWFGPFCASVYDASLTEACDAFRNELRGPIREPQEDNPSKHWHQGHHVSGVVDYYQMRHWGPNFSDTWRLMHRAGFRIGVYDVPESKVGFCNTQVFWAPEDATFLKSTTIEEMREEFFNA